MPNVRSGNTNTNFCAKKATTKVLFLKKLMSFAEFITRECLPNGNWFNCPAGSVNTTAGAWHNYTTRDNAWLSQEEKDRIVGWSNFTQCYLDTTKKLVVDIFDESGCPDMDAIREQEVRTSYKYLQCSTPR